MQVDSHCLNLFCLGWFSLQLKLALPSDENSTVTELPATLIPSILTLSVMQTGAATERMYTTFLRDFSQIIVL